MDKERELWGHRFKIVKNGLDEDDVITYVESLQQGNGSGGDNPIIGQRLARLDSVVSELADRLNGVLGKLESAGGAGISPADGDATGHIDSLVTGVTERLELLANRLSQIESANGGVPANAPGFDVEKLNHLNSLTRLAERTVIDAEKEAEGIVAEAADKARVEAENIIGEARAEADGIARQAREKAEKDAQLIKEEADRLLAKSRELVEAEIKGMFDQAYGRLLANFQVDEQEPTTVDSRDSGPPADDTPSEGDGQLPSDSAEEPVMADASEHEQEPPAGLENDESSGEDGSAESSEEESPDTAESEYSVVPLDGQAEQDADTDQQPAEATDEPTADSSEVDQTQEPQEESSESAANQEQPEDPEVYSGTVELAIPPPVGLDQVMQLHKDLKQTPDLEVLNFGGSVDKGITIRMTCKAPTRLVEVLNQIDGVKEAMDEANVEEQLVPSRAPGQGPMIRRVVVIVG